MKLSSRYITFLLGILAFRSVIALEEPFGLSLTILDPIVVTESQSLLFPFATQGIDTSVTVAPTDATGAVFSVTGSSGSSITASVVEDDITLITGGGELSAEQIQVRSWTFGGDLLDIGDSGTATLTDGSLADLRIGATAVILAEDVVGEYIGAATFRVVYQ